MLKLVAMAAILVGGCTYNESDESWPDVDAALAASSSSVQDGSRLLGDMLHELAACTMACSTDEQCAVPCGRCEEGRCSRP